MNCTHAIFNTTHRRRAGRRRAFTLVELMVAIGIVAFLVVAIGEIFRSVGRLVSLGIASAEVEQMARSIERQMRDDFDALSAMRSEDTFIAIRMREQGDANHNNMLDSGETAVYLTQDDREADQRDIAAGAITGPYAPGSRAVTVRLDEMMFLAQRIASGDYTSFEADRQGVSSASAGAARIYYGQALRPAPDPNWPPDASANNPPRIPQRMNVPDGDFGQRAGDDNRFVQSLSPIYNSASDLQQATGRNEYATSWILARQALLLAGGKAAGSENIPFGVNEITGPGNEREYAPYIRDLETLDRFWGAGGGQGPYGFGLDHQGPRSGFLDPVDPSSIYPPAPRLIQHGRVDLCAQSLSGVERWLEGEPPTPSGALPLTLASQLQSPPFREGRFSVGALQDGYNNQEFSGPAFNDPARSARGMLWQQPNPTQGSPGQAYFDTRRGIRAAIAGAFTRVLADSQPPYIDRDRDTTNIIYPINNAEQPSDAEDAYMDSSAVLAERCSDFEIAWRLTDPDWPVAHQQQGIDIDGDGAPEFQPGDRIWIDITPLDLNNPDQTRSTAQSWLPPGPLSQFDTGQPPSFGALPPTGGTPFADANEQPELGYEDWRSPSGVVFDFDFAQAVAQSDTQTSSNGNPPPFPLYNPEISGGAPVQQKEYLAIWPFRAPNTNGGGYEDAGFPKKLQIRIRMTLHDSQHRIKGGRTFEFIFNVSPGG